MRGCAHEFEQNDAGQDASCRTEHDAHEPHEAVFQAIVPEERAAARDDRTDEGDADEHDLVDAVAEVDVRRGSELHEDPSQNDTDDRGREGLAGHDQLPPPKGKGLGLETAGECIQGHAVASFVVAACCQAGIRLMRTQVRPMRAPLVIPRA